MSNFMPNSFQVPNDLVDKYLLYLTDLELKVFLIIIRKTKGWQKEKDYISYSQFKRILNIKDDRTIKKAIKGLLKLNLIFKFERRGKISGFSINLNPNPLHADDPCHSNVGGTSTCNNPLHKDAGGPPTTPCTPTKDNNTKEIKNTTTSSSCKNLKDLEDWLEKKCKNVKNKQAYKATLLKKYKKEEKSVIEEFHGWQKETERQKETEKLISLQHKKIILHKNSFTILGVEKKDNTYTVHLQEPYQNSYRLNFINLKEIEKRIQHAS